MSEQSGADPMNEREEGWVSDDEEYEALFLSCVICGERQMEGWQANDAFYCSVRCLASDGRLTPHQALTARHTEVDIGLDESEVDEVADRCPRCGSTNPEQFIWAEGCQWPTGGWHPWHMPNSAERLLRPVRGGSRGLTP